MKRFMNTAETMVAESLEGFVSAHKGIVVFGAGRKCIRRASLTPGKVAIISGGGAGHEPLHIGFVGRGMLDAACTGHIFTSPTPDQIIAAIEETDTGAGCLLVVKNYDGDLMNFEMAAEFASRHHRIEMVISSDDVETEGARSNGRRGVAGTLVLEKILGAAAEAGQDLAGLKRLADGLAPRIRTMGVALSGVTVPQTERTTFALDAGEMEMGVGIHGEPGRSREAFTDVGTIVGRICTTVVDALPKEGRSPALLFVNGLGSTPPAELYLAYNAARQWLEERGLSIAGSLVGTYVTSLDMCGLSVTVALLTEDELSLWNSPVATASLRWGE